MSKKNPLEGVEILSGKPKPVGRPCTGKKISYPDRKSAKKSAIKQKRKGYNLRPYLCSCGKYHLAANTEGRWSHKKLRREDPDG